MKRPAEETDVPAKKSLRWSFSEDVEVLVGAEQKHYTVHKDFITARSMFFEAACSERWRSGDPPKPIELPDDDPEIWEGYLFVLYNSVCSTKEMFGVDPQEIKDEETADQTFVSLAKLHVLADKLQDQISANAIMDEFMKCSDQWHQLPDADCINFVCSNTVDDDSPLRRLLLDYFIYDAAVAGIQMLKNTRVPREFVYTVLEGKTALMEDGRWMRIEDKSFYVFVQTHKHRYHRHRDSDTDCECIKEREQGEKLYEPQRVRAFTGILH